MPGFRLEMTRFLVKRFFDRRYKLIISYEDFDRKRKEPYFLISNHVQLNDPLLVGMNLKYYPYPVASNTLYTNPLLRFALTKLVTSIPKRKGQADTQTIRQIRNSFYKLNRGIQVCPEGNSSFFGEQTPTDFTSTAKLVKKMKFDIVIGHFDGGYFAGPRWADHYRKKAPIYLHYKRLVRAEDLDLYKVEELAQLLEKEIAFNDYEWNKKAKVKYLQKNKAEGSENFLYGCPKCHSIGTISSKGNDIFCSQCGKVATIDDYHMYDSPYVKTMIEWGAKQKEWLKPHQHETFESKGKFYELHLDKMRRTLLGKNVILKLKDNLLSIELKHKIYQINIQQMKGVALTQQNKISFDDGNRTYLMKMEHVKLFFDLIKLKKGEQQL